MKYRWIHSWSVAAGILFVLLTIVSMLTYPGGRIGHPQSAGYSFWLNFFSDLGRARTFTGGPKLISYSSFAFALVCAGITGILYFATFPEFFRNTRQFRLVQMGSLAGVVSSYCFVGIALAPWDLYLLIHLGCVYVAFSSLLLAVLCFIPSILKSAVLPPRYAFVYAGFALILGAYLCILFFGPRATDTGLMIQATAQKVVVYANVICMLIQSYGMLCLPEHLPNAH
ncbi:MAG: hypothetical protein JNM27_14245 [Leptospirales bacterium]|nr:hypothetical protein [Leptospirales bacterium]